MSEIKQGYKQTKVGIIPEDWEIVKLGKLTTVETGKTPLRSNKQFWDNGTINWATTTEVNETYIVSTNEKITNQAVAELKMKILPINTILLAMYGQGKTRGKVALLRIESTINQAFASIKPNKNYSTNFIFNYLDKSYEKIRDLSHGSNQDNLNLDIVKALQIPLPPLKEQEKIAQILTTWDEAITKQTELLRAKELQKKALMQKLLSGEVRFDGFNDEWEMFSLNEVLKERKTYQSKGLELEHVSLTKEGVVPKSERYERDFLVKEEDKQYKITKLNDICYNPANLKFGVICKNTYGDGIFSPIYVTFETKKGFNIDFLGYFLTWNDFIKKVRRFEEGTVYERMAVNPKDFLSFKTKLPSLPEQQKIAEVLSLADDEINLLKNEFEELKLQKKALMQKLLTGEVRVKV